jgi:hypothetical protein
MALFSPVLGTIVTTLALSPPASPQQLAGVACNLIHSEEQRHVGLESLRGGRYAAAAKAIQDSFDACPSQHAILLELSRVDVHLRDFPGAIGAPNGSSNWSLLRWTIGSLSPTHISWRKGRRMLCERPKRC